MKEKDKRRWRRWRVDSGKKKRKIAVGKKTKCKRRKRNAKGRKRKKRGGKAGEKKEEE